MRRYSWLLCLVLLAGCGPATSAPPAKTAPSSAAPASAGASQPPSKAPQPTSGPVLLTAQAPVPQMLAPTRVIGLRKGSFKAPLQGSGVDTLSIVPASGDTNLVIKDAQGTVLQSLPHVGRVGVLEFGSAHLPLIITETSASMCGSGGCSYASYTWSPPDSSFVLIPPPATTGYSYVPAQSAFKPVPLPNTPQLGSFFGFASLDSGGLSFDNRLYDLWQHSQTLHYAYSSTPAPYGSWVQQGQPSYAPQGPVPSLSFTDPGQAVLALVQARALDLPKQGATLEAAGSAGSDVWTSLAPLADLGPTLSWGANDPKVSTQGSEAQVTATLYGTSGDGPSMVLHTYNLSATVSTTTAGAQVTAASLTPVPHTVSTVPELLKAILSDASLRGQLAAKSAMIAVNVRGPKTWELEWVTDQSMSPWITVDADTGTAAAAPSTP